MHSANEIVPRRVVRRTSSPSKVLVDGLEVRRTGRFRHCARLLRLAMSRSLLLLLALAFVSPVAEAQERTRSQGFKYPPELTGARAEVFKKIGDIELKLFVFQPQAHQPTDKRAAVVFFFGGGWSSGSPSQFQRQAEHLAKRGMVAICADYRVKIRHQVQADKCLTDAKSAVRWVRQHAAKLGVDPDRIAAGGGSAGGHLAAATALVPGFEEAGEDLAISSQPNALALFNPAVMLAPAEGLPTEHAERVKRIDEMTGGKAKSLSPYHFIKSGQPPTIVFHGTGDSTVPFVTVELFGKAMRAAGNRCEIVPFEGEPHGFFNPGRSKGDDKDAAFKRSLQLTDEFFVSLGYLPKS